MDINPTNSYQNMLNMLGKGSSQNTDGQPAAADANAGKVKAASQTSGSAATNRASDTNAYSDKVSLSYRAEKLSKISTEFFGGTIQSSQIPALTQRLYENGFLNDSQYRDLGGAQQKVSAISQANAFISRQILAEPDGNSEMARQLVQVANVLANMDAPTTPELRRAEADAYEFMASHSEALQQQGAPEELRQGFARVMEVLEALDKVRKQEQSTGALSSYASVQEAWQSMQNDEE